MTYPALNFAILSIPKHLYRVCIMLGHFSTRGFPILEMIRRKRLTIYNGFDYRQNFGEICQAMSDDGFQIGTDMLRYYEGGKRYDAYPLHARVVHFNMLKILRAVANGNRPTLILESDVFWRSLDYQGLLARWDELIGLVGYENINVAMFFSYENNKDQDEIVVDLSEFWGRKSRNSGQVANIWTPHGAQYYLDQDDRTSVEVYLREKGETMPGLFTTLRNEVDFTFGAEIDSPRRNAETMQLIQTFLEGVDICQQTEKRVSK